MNYGVSNATRTTRPTAVVTGAVDGLGAEVAVLLARRGYDLVLLNRSRERTRPLLDRLMTEAGDVAVEIVEVDLADQDSLVKGARNVVSHHRRIDVLFNNAGVLLDGHHVSRHQNELHFRVNTLAPYILMRLLPPALAAAPDGRVMNVSSGSIALTGRLRIDALRNPRTRRKLVGPYAQSKLALTTLTNALAEDFGRDGIILRSADPGATKTRMTQGAGMPRFLRWLQPLFFQDPLLAAERMIDALLGPQFGAQTGIYLARGKVCVPPADATNSDVQRRLLALCESLTTLEAGCREHKRADRCIGQAKWPNNLGPTRSGLLRGSDQAGPNR